MSQKRVAIIGAGAAGLICAKECIREGLDVQIFEKFPHSGGLWVVDKVPKDLQELNVCADDYSEMASKVYSSIYDNLQTNTSRYIMGFSDFPFDEEFHGSKDTRLFPGADEVARYLDAFKEEYDLEQYISYATEVIEVTRNEHSDIEWQIRYQSNGEVKSSQFHAIAVCSGHHTVPALPDLKKVEGFCRPCLHSHLYRSPVRYKDKVVVILGNRSSARDIALDISSQAKKVYICGRRKRKEDSSSKVFGAKPNVTMCSDISHCPAEGTVELVDGTLLTDIDEILFCTGYAHDFTFLKDIQLTFNTELLVYPLYKDVFHAHHPTLGFIGATRLLLPFLAFDCQSKYFAKVTAGKCQLPDHKVMMKEVEQNHARVEEEMRDLTCFHDLKKDPFVYLNELLSLCDDCSEIPSWKRDALFIHLPLLMSEPHLFRTIELPPEILKRAKEDFNSVLKYKPNQQRE